MPLQINTQLELKERIKTDIQQELAVDPSVDGSFENAIAISNGNRFFDIQNLIKSAALEWFPQTATKNGSLELHAQYVGLSRLPAVISSGNVTAVGTLGKNIPLGTQLIYTSGTTYTTQLAALIAEQIVVITTLTRLNNVVTATTNSEHFLSSGMSVTISGADQVDYNGVFVITSLSNTEFSYEVIGNPTTPATGVITANFTGAVIPIESVDFGKNQNIASGGQLQLVSSLEGVESTFYVPFAGITGGRDVESSNQLKERILYVRRFPVANFNISAVTLKVWEVTGFTRVFVKMNVNIDVDITGWATIVFVLDDNDNLIPDTGLIQKVKDSIVSIIPVTSDPSKIIVMAPELVETDFTFSDLTPETLTMRTAVADNIRSLYNRESTLETTITEDKYRSAIINTIDTATNEPLQSFTLTAPTGDIVINTNEIGIAGNITFL